MKRTVKYVGITIIVLFLLVLVYDATYGFNGLFKKKPKPQAAQPLPPGFEHKPSSHFYHNPDGSIDYSRQADGTPIPLG